MFTFRFRRFLVPVSCTMLFALLNLACGPDPRLDSRGDKNLQQGEFIGLKTDTPGYIRIMGTVTAEQNAFESWLTGADSTHGYQMRLRSGNTYRITYQGESDPALGAVIIVFDAHSGTKIYGKKLGQKMSFVAEKKIRSGNQLELEFIPNRTAQVVIAVGSNSWVIPNGVQNRYSLKVDDLGSLCPTCDDLECPAFSHCEQVVIDWGDPLGSIPYDVCIDDPLTPEELVACDPIHCQPGYHCEVVVQYDWDGPPSRGPFCISNDDSGGRSAYTSGVPTAGGTTEGDGACNGVCAFGAHCSDYCPSGAHCRQVLDTDSPYWEILGC